MATMLKGSNNVPLTVHEAFSGIWGMISLCCTIFLTIPQIFENYRAGSASGISMLFLFIWFVGDIANLLGAVWAGLVPTVIGIAVYFCLSDLVLIGQCLFYNVRNARRDKLRQRGRHAEASGADARGEETTGEAHQDEDTESEMPLLSRRTSTHSIGPPGSLKRRRSSAASRHTGNGHAEYGTLAKIIEGEEDGAESTKRERLKNTLGLAFVIVVGVVVWVIAWQIGAWKPTASPGDKQPVPPGEDGKNGEGGNKTPVGAEILGYISAILYLGARIPQILKNWKDQSCEGLSLLFFMLSLLSNLTYGAQIFCHSLQKDYLITNIPWLIGSLGTMFEDIIIFVQFHIYGDRARGEAQESESAVEERSNSHGSGAVGD